MDNRYTQIELEKKFTSTFTTESPDDRTSPGLSLLKVFLVLLLSFSMTAGSLTSAFAEDEEEDNNLYLPVHVDYDKAYDVLDRVNNERSKRGRGTLPMDQTLMDAAYVRAVETVLYFEHARPNGDTWSSVDAKVDGENLGMGTGSTAEIMRLWMESPGHKENIIYPEFDCIGVSCIEYKGIHYWVQLFSRSASEGAERKANGAVSLPLDLPSSEEGGEFSLDYSITIDGSAEEEADANANGSETYQLGLRAEGMDFDPSRLKWTVSDSEIAAIDEKGVLSIKGKGRARISAASGIIERADMDLDSRVDMKDLYIMDRFSHRPELSSVNPIEGITPMPEVIVLSAEGPLVKDRDYSVTYKDADAEGEASAEIRGCGGYKGIIIKEFNISEPADS